MQGGLTLLLLATLAGQTQATDEVELVKPRARQGFYIGLGTGSALMGIDAEPVGNLGFFRGGYFAFRFGQMVNDLIGFGMTFELGGGQSSEWAGGYGALSVGTQLAPFDVVDIAFHAQVGVAGAGVGRKDEDLEQEDDPSGNYGTMYTLGVSYDWFPFYDKGDSGGFAITSFVEGRLLHLTGDFIGGGLFVGVQISWFFGFGKNRLDLSVEDAFKK